MLSNAADTISDQQSLDELSSLFASFAAYDHSISVPELGSLFQYTPDSPLGSDQRQLARLYGVPFVWPSTNGTTAINALAVSTVAAMDESILIQRDSHTSIFAPVINLGLRPTYLAPRYDHELGVPLGPTPAQIAAALDHDRSLSTVVLTYPNYWGIAFDLRGCVAAARARGAQVIVDSAHGAHFRFHPGLPEAAELSGASIVTQSIHKTGTALSQGALALFNDADLVSRFYEMVNQLGFVSTSFSYPILQSIMLGVQQLASGPEHLDAAITIAGRVRAEIDQLPLLRCFGADALAPAGCGLDPLRVTVDVQALGITGYAVEERLIHEFRIYPEMATLRHVLFLFTAADAWESGRRLVEALRRIVQTTARREPIGLGRPPAIPRRILNPRAAFLSRRRSRVPVWSAVGGVSGETIAAYPPGSPILVAGEEITAAALSFLTATRTAGGVLKGASDPTLETITVVDAAPEQA